MEEAGLKAFLDGGITQRATEPVTDELFALASHRGDSNTKSVLGLH